MNPSPQPQAARRDRCSGPPRPTARLSHHARLRCQEMGLGTKAVKAVVAAPEIVAPARHGLRMLVAGVLAVVYDDRANEVVTVLWAQGVSRADGPVRQPAG